MNRRALWGWLVCAVFLCLLKADAQPVTTLYSFVRGPINPHAGVTLGNDGNFYGTTAAGGRNLGGTIYRMTTNGVLTTLFPFSGYPSGSGPTADLTLGPDGYFYGTTTAGGTNLTGDNAGGVVFKMTTNGIPTTVVNFIGTNGGHPDAAVTLGPDGCYYGTTEFSGSNNVGTVFKVTTNGLLTTLVTFNNTNGANPGYSLTLAPGGTFYGTTKAGGQFGFGTAFKLTTNGNFTLLHSFDQTNLTLTDQNSEGATPSGRMALGPDGNLYGTTLLPDTAFQMTTNGLVTTLYNFEASNNGTNGGLPYSGLTLGPDGNFYGTASDGGTNGTGTIFQISTNGILAALNRLPGIQYQYVTNGQGFTLIYYSTNNFTTSTLIGTTGTLGLNGVFTELYSFSALTNSDNGDGADPESDLTVGPDGDLYGTTVGGGTYGAGAVFKISTNGTFTALASFAGNTGYNPYAGVTAGPGGSLYGVVTSGGTTGYGTAYKVSSGGQFTLLNNFSYFPNGANPQAPLIQGPDGNFYGTAAGGGTNLLQTGPSSYQAESFGTVFELSTNGAFTMLAYFAGTNGANPYGGLTIGPGGNFFGTTSAGGISNSGVVFELFTNNGALIALTNFTGVNGAFPYEGLTLGLDGNFYGTTEGGGSNNNGTVFQVTPAGALKTLVYFNGTNGANPNDGLTLGRDGNLYGTTYTSTPDNSGTVFQITTGGAFTNLYTFVRTNFAFTHGQHPVGGLAQGLDGCLYGTTALGGVNNSAEGTLFKITTNGTLTTLNSFLIPNGSAPFATLTLQTNSNFINFYGTTLGDGSDHPGTVYRVNQITSYAITENTAHTLSPLTNEVIWITGGTVGLLTAVATNGAAQISGSTIGFTPTTNFTGTATISYTVTDNAGGTNTSFITILVTNIPPVANPDFYSVAENSSGNVLSPLVNDQVNTSGGVLGLVRVSATNGAAVISGTNVLFTPTASFTGTATIGYTITDNVGGTNTSLITVIVVNTTADLSLSAVSGGNATNVVGGSQAYFLTVSNAGPATAAGVVISNQIPANETFYSVTGGATPTSGVLLVNLGSLAAGAVTNLTLIVYPTLPPGQATGQLTNQFQVFASTTDPVPANNSATVVITVNLPIPGTPLTYTGSNPGGAVFISNDSVFGIGPIKGGTPGAFVTLTAEAGDLIVLTDPAGGNNPTNWAAVARFFNPSDLTGTNGLAATETEAFFATSLGGSGFTGFQLFPNIDFIPAGTISTTNGVTVIATTDNEFGPAGIILAGQENIDAIGITSDYADLSLTASAAPQPVTVGNNLVYSVVVTNQAGLTATGVVVSNRIPANCTFVSATGGATPASGVLLLNLGSLTNGAVTNVQVTMQPTAAGTLTDLFQVFANEADPVLTNNSVAVISTVTNAVVVSYDFPGTPIAWTNPGGSLVVTYTYGFAGNPVPVQIGSGTNAASTGQAGDLVLLFTNNGVTVPTNWAAVVRFYNPADPTGSQGLAATYEQTFFATNFGGSGFNGYQLFPAVSYIPDGTVTTNTSGPLTFLSFTTSYTEFGPAGGIIPGQEDIDVVSLFSQTTAVAITSPTNGQVVSNSAFTVTGMTTNYAYNGVGLTNFEVTNVFVQLNGGTWTNATSVNGWTNWSANMTLTPGSNTVSAYAENGYGSDSPTNTVTFDYAASSPQADLKLSASAAPEPVGVNSNLVYSITITNLGPNAAGGVTISNQLPFGVTFVSATGGATPASGVLLINLGALTNGAATNVQVIVQPTAAGKLTNLFQVFSSTTDPLLTNNFATVISTVTNPAVVSQADLKLSANAAPEPVGVNSNLVYSISITNQGPNPASGVTVSNQLPAGVTFVSATGGATPASGVLLLNLGSLTNGAVTNVQVTVQPTAAGKLTNLFQVFSSTADPVPTNNFATIISTVTNGPPPPVDVAVSVTAAPNPVAVGAPLTISVTVTNNSITTATGVVVSNTLPPDVTLFSLLPSQGSATNQAGVVIYSVGSLANGVAATLAIVVVPNAAGSLTNSDSATSGQTDSQPANNRATNIVTVVSVPITNLVLTVQTPMTLNPQTGLYEQQIEVSNGGPSTPSSVLVEVSGLKTNVTLYNATGKTNGLPYVQSASPLGIGSNVVFLLEFYVPTRVMPTNLTYIVQAGPIFIPPVASGTIVSVQKTVVLDGGDVLVEFKAVPGQIYAVQYSSDMVTWLTAIPAITAPANEVQWIDSGPPGTISNPAQAGARFYRVVLLNKH
ncbi:MAG TPA: choice-of-anchor tandem repeat GloVer-containing protein [Candidatus Sulfotelmatobacter sp.]|jgi:uncharacterized repeat protein (TIGR01451 family)|nr:choice-of-anchor tandem repeat GloVer-containing protein [Candidatus Sulfotelmatobacter sp.]